MQPSIIAIDGPAGSGKSTLGAALARRLGYSMLDIGVVYRLVTIVLLELGLDPDAEADAVRAAETVLSGLVVENDKSATRLLLDGKEIDQSDLNTDAVNATVPLVARHEPVRQRVREVQRRIAASGRAILAGRDIGSVVLPDADLKLYLDVSLEERAARRSWSPGGNDMPTHASIAASLAERDRLDAERHFSPLVMPSDAVCLRTDHLTVDATVELIMSMCGMRESVVNS